MKSIAHYSLYLANKAVETQQLLDVDDKYQQQVFAKVSLADEHIVEQAIVAAVKAESAMAQLKPYQKQNILLHCVEQFKKRRDELTEILILE